MQSVRSVSAFAGADMTTPATKATVISSIFMAVLLSKNYFNVRTATGFRDLSQLQWNLSR
jgi:hypothetical protein